MPKHEFVKLQNQNPAGFLGTLLRKTLGTDSHEYYRCWKCGVLYCKTHDEYVLSFRKSAVKHHPCSPPPNH